MELSRQVWVLLVVGIVAVISFIAQGVLLYRAFLHSAPSVTVARAGRYDWIYLRREEFTARGWRYRQAAVACWLVPVIAFVVAEVVLNV